MCSLDRKSSIALITGASSGIGAELSKEFARDGGKHLVAVARDKQRLMDLKAEIEDSWDCLVYPIEQDLAEPNAAQKILQAYKNLKLGSLKYLVNNAGFGHRGFFIGQDLEKHRKMVQVNAMAITDLLYLFLPQMIENKGGRVMNISSTAALVPGPMQAVYFATKAFVSSLGNALAEELRGNDIKVTTCMPPPTESNFAKEAQLENSILFRKTVSAEDVAKIAYRAMMKGKLNVFPSLNFGQKLLLALIPFSPKTIVLRIVRKLHQVPKE